MQIGKSLAALIKYSPFLGALKCRFLTELSLRSTKKQTILSGFPLTGRALEGNSEPA